MRVVAGRAVFDEGAPGVVSPPPVWNDRCHGQRWRRSWIVTALGAWLAVGMTGERVGTSAAAEAAMWRLTSSVFDDGAAIPSRYTCDGRDISPPLAWTEPPAGTNSLALIHDDPDAPGKTWVHWVLYNLPPALRSLPEAFPPDQEFADGTRQGVTDFGRTGYGGPCPPSGTHRYVFKLYALDTVLSLAPGATKRQTESAMEGHLLAQAKLIGTYRRATR